MQILVNISDDIGEKIKKEKQEKISPSYSFTVHKALSFYFSSNYTQSIKNQKKQISSFDIDEVFAEIKKRNPSEERNGRHKRWHIEKAIENFGAAKILKEIAKCQDNEKITADNLNTLCTWIPKEHRNKNGKPEKPKVNTTDEWIPDEQYGGLKINRNYIPK